MARTVPSRRTGSLVRGWLFPVVGAWLACAGALAGDGGSSPFGPDDRHGALNHLSAAQVVAAAGLIRSGKVYSLAIPTAPDTAAYGSRNYRVHVAPIYVGDAATYGMNRLQGYDDVVISQLGVGTQLDGFAHVAVDGRHYNGVPSSEVIRPNGARQFGIEQVPPIVGRGVLLDMLATAGGSLARDTVFDRAALEKALARIGVTLSRGDIVLLHTGHLARDAAERWQQDLAAVPGLGVEGARWLADQGVAAVGMDAWIPDALPAEDRAAFLPVHGLLLVERGVHILENVRTDELAADAADTFFFALAAPRFSGAVQSVVHPIAVR